MITTALLLIFTGPWLVYLLIPVPDQLAEYRNYSMVAGFALLASLLPWPLWTPLLAYFVGMSHVHAMAWTDQITFWKKALKTGSGDRSRANQEVGAVLKISGNNAAAEPYFLEALRLNPRLAPALENLTSIYFLTGREKEGFITAEVLVERCPLYASGWQTMGVLHERRERWTDARMCFERAVSLGTMAQSANHLGLMAFKEKRFDCALEWFQKAGASHPAEPTFQYNEAMALYGLGRTDEANVIRDRFQGIALPWNPEMVPQPQAS